MKLPLEFVDHSVHSHPCTDPPPALALVGVALLVVPAGDWTSSHVRTSVILSWNILLPWGQTIQWGIPTRWLNGRPAAFIPFRNYLRGQQEVVWTLDISVAKYLIGFRTWTGLRESLDTCKWKQSNSSLESWWPFHQQTRCPEQNKTLKWQNVGNYRGIPSIWPSG